MKFDELFKHVNIPIIICRDDETLTVVYENKAAIRLLNPLESTDSGFTAGSITIADLLHMETPQWEEFWMLLDKNDEIPVYYAELLLYSGEKTVVNLAASRIDGDSRRFIQFCLQEKKITEDNTSTAFEKIFNLIYQAPSTDAAIQQVLAFAGEWTGVSRSYIFEAVSDTTTSNTYEWCMPGVVPEIENLRELPKKEYSYDAIIQRGLAVTDDIRKLSSEDREILEVQGIKALAIIPLMSHDGPLGYVGLDDCENYRTWTQREVQFLGNLAEVLTSLMIRRNSERGIRYGLEVLDVIINSLDSMVMAVDIHSRQILFVNNALASLAGCEAGTLKDKTLSEAFGAGYQELQENNPLDDMMDTEGKVLHQHYMWEYFNKHSKKWYLVRAAIIKWIDGSDVMIETATEFTKQKVHEAELEYEASVDMMTGAYNREWSRRLLDNILSDSDVRKNNSLVFIDLDHLKQTNDRYGHSGGDKMILNTLECIKACIRKSDVLCRWGGDEFLIVIRANEEQSNRVMKKIRTRMERYNARQKDGIILSFSYGVVAIDSRKFKSVEELVNAADQRMYINKQQRRKALF